MGILWKFSLRHAIKRPLRSTFTLLTIVIGVALVVGSTIATSTTRSAYYEMFSSVSGRTAIEVVPVGGGLMDEKVLATVDQTPGVAAASPMLQKPTILYHGDGESKAKLLTLGVDPQRDRAIRPYTLKEGRLFQRNEAAIVMESEFARGLKLKVGDKAKILTRDGVRELELVGTLSAEGAESLRMAGIVFLPLERAQAWFRAKGRVGSIQVVVDEGVDERQVRDTLAAALPDDLIVRRPSTRTQIMDEAMNPSQQGVQWGNIFALLSAAFIILNTFLMNISERRQQLAIMRCIGATRGQLARLILGESLVLGLLGSILGCAVGVLVASVPSSVMSNLMQVAQPPLKITYLPFVLAFVFGIGLSLLGAAAPTILAALLSPLEGLSPVTRHMPGVSRGITIAAIIVVIVCTTILWGSISGWLPIHLAVWATVILMLGLVLLIGEVLTLFSHLLVWILLPILKISARLAHREVLRHRLRSSLTIGVLFVSTATGLGLANIILDNVQDVRNWADRTLVGDFFIRAMMPDMMGGESANIPDEMADEIKELPGIERIDTAKFIQADAAGQQVMIIVRDFKPDQQLQIDLRDRDRDQVRDELFEGSVIIGTVLAQKTGLKAGGTIPIVTKEGTKDFRIAALSNEYLVSGLAIYMERGAARQFFPVEGVDAYVVKAEPEQRAEVEERLKPLCDKYGVLLHSFADIATMIDGMIRGVQVVLYATIALSFFVAAIGVFNTLMMNVLEQTRELGLLRIVAMTRGQVRKTVFTQAGIIGVIGLTCGIVGGLIIAYLMHLSLLRAIGHPSPFIFRPVWYFATAGIGLVIVLIAAWLPAERAARLDLPTALQYE